MTKVCAPSLDAAVRCDVSNNYFQTKRDHITNARNPSLIARIAVPCVIGFSTTINLDIFNVQKLELFTSGFACSS